MQSYFSAVMLDSVQLDLFYYDDTNYFFIVCQINFKFSNIVKSFPDIWHIKTGQYVK